MAVYVNARPFKWAKYLFKVLNNGLTLEQGRITVCGSIGTFEMFRRLIIDSVLIGSSFSRMETSLIRFFS